MSKLSDQVLHHAAEYLANIHTPRLRKAVETLPAADLWWRPHPEAISVGTILLHLEGNVRQWILSGLKGEKDQRDRASEFAAQTGPPVEELLEKLETTARRAAKFINKMSRKDLRKKYKIQGQKVSGVEVLIHVVEHYAWHTGQAVWIAKARAGAGHGLAFYEDAIVNADATVNADDTVKADATVNADDTVNAAQAD